MKGFKKKYSDSNGHENYYEKLRLTRVPYSNPHSNKLTYVIKDVLDYLPQNLFTPGADSPIIDLAAGSGQITNILTLHGISNIVGIDPYLYQQYSENTSRQVYPNTFDDICNGVLSFENVPIVFCSYALHLCKDINSLLDKLKMWTKYLCIITPNGLPYVNNTNWKIYEKFKCAGIKVFIYEINADSN